jgi:hypothetical protein
MVRNAVWKVVRQLAFKQYERASQALEESGDESWPAERLSEALAAYWAEYDAIEIGPDARSASQVQIERGTEAWSVRQILLDPEGHREWRLLFEVDLAASRDASEPRIALAGVER